MKKYIFSSIPFFAILILLPSCEDVVKIDLPKGKPLFVVDAFINDFNEKQIIKLSNRRRILKHKMHLQLMALRLWLRM